MNLTDEQIDAMQWGCDIDSMVASAVFDEFDWNVEARDDGGTWIRVKKHIPTLNMGVLEYMMPFIPSLDWNDAMFAAEKFGLFDTEKHGHTMTYSDLSDCGSGDKRRWFIADYESEDIGDQGSSWPTGAPTGPLAICRAILKLARDKT